MLRCIEPDTLCISTKLYVCIRNFLVLEKIILFFHLDWIYFIYLSTINIFNVIPLSQHIISIYKSRANYLKDTIGIICGVIIVGMSIFSMVKNPPKLAKGCFKNIGTTFLSTLVLSIWQASGYLNSNEITSTSTTTQTTTSLYRARHLIYLNKIICMYS